MKIDEKVVLGLDIGISSIGWALLQYNSAGEPRLMTRDSGDGRTQYAIGSRIFSAPEDPKTMELLNVKRRNARQQRRVVHRRAQRMRHIRKLLSEYGMKSVLDVESFHHPQHSAQLNPWELRKKGLVRLLSPDELACILIHMARHRGFMSNSKRDASEKETGQMLKALSVISKETLAAQTTVGAFMADKPLKRNRRDYAGNAVYDCTLPRLLLEEETDRLYECQQQFGSKIFSAELRDAYKLVAFKQRPLASVSDMVGKCLFLENERRAPAFAPTSERFRLVQRLTNLRLKNGKEECRLLHADEIKRILALQGHEAQATVSYKTIRKLLKLPKETFFENLGTSVNQKGGRDPECADVVRKSGAALPGSAIFLKCLGQQSFNHLYRLRLTTNIDPAESLCLDYIARILSENDDKQFICKELSRLPLEDNELRSLKTALEDGFFASFQGTMRLSLKAMEIILPYLEEGRSYYDACCQAGFDPTKEHTVDVNDIRNPVVQRVVREVRRQVAAICNDWNVFPGRVNIELLRDVGKSPRERKEITKGLEDRTKERLKSREELAKHFGVSEESISGGEVLRFELWKSQQGMCAYYMLWHEAGGQYSGDIKDGYIPLSWLRDGSNAVQVDHILPRSRTFDNSFNNLCLCCTSANQAKGGKTPYEWIGKENLEAWHAFSEWVRSTIKKGLKKRNFLLENLNAEIEQRFHARNRTDSSYAARLIAAWFRDEYERLGATLIQDNGQEKRRVFARPGAVTAFLRHQWGVDRLKKDEMGQRLEDDRHHAIDAVVLACCTEGQLQRITRAFQKEETERSRLFIALPWENFVKDVTSARDAIFVSRALRPKKSGALHEETLHSICTEKTETGELREIIYERKHITELKLADLKRIKDPSRCPDLVSALEAWLTLTPKERMLEKNLPRSAHGDIIRHVRLRSDSKGGVRLQRGSGVAQADNATMARVDVYSKDKKFYLVPVYLKQLADGILPLKAIVAHKEEKDWLTIDEHFEFCFSLESDCYVIVTRKSQETLEGYYVCTHRGTGAITLSFMQGRAQRAMTGIGVQRLIRFEKYIVDRLGRLHRVHKEVDPRLSANGVKQK